MVIAIDRDEAAYELKETIGALLPAEGREGEDSAPFDARPVLYPDFRAARAHARTSRIAAVP